MQGALAKWRYKLWKDRLDNPTCEAEFRRMLQLGLVNKVRLIPISEPNEKTNLERVDGLFVPPSRSSAGRERLGTA